MVTAACATNGGEGSGGDEQAQDPALAWEYLVAESTADMAIELATGETEFAVGQPFRVQARIISHSSGGGPVAVDLNLPVDWLVEPPTDLDRPRIICGVSRWNAANEPEPTLPSSEFWRCWTPTQTADETVELTITPADAGPVSVGVLIRTGASDFPGENAWQQLDPNPEDNTASIDLVIDPGPDGETSIDLTEALTADLVISVTPATVRAAPGERVEVVVEYSNLGPDPSRAVQLVIDPSEATTVHSATDCDDTTQPGQLVCDIGDPMGTTTGRRAYVLQVSPNAKAGQHYEVTITARSESPDPADQNNLTTIALTITDPQ